MARKKGRKGKTEEVFHVGECRMRPISRNNNGWVAYSLLAEVIVKARVAAPENEGDKPSWASTKPLSPGIHAVNNRHGHLQEYFVKVR